MGRKATSERFSVARGYRRLLVPLDAAAESFHALELACRFAADSHARITALCVIEVPALLPLDAHLRDEEDAAQRLLERAGATADSYGVKVSAKIVRARDVGAAIVEQAVADHVELIVLGVRRARLAVAPGQVDADIVHKIIASAPSRVMVVSAPEREAA